MATSDDQPVFGNGFCCRICTECLCLMHPNTLEWCSGIWYNHLRSVAGKYESMSCWHAWMILNVYSLYSWSHLRTCLTTETPWMTRIASWNIIQLPPPQKKGTITSMPKTLQLHVAQWRQFFASFSKSTAGKDQIYRADHVANTEVSHCSLQSGREIGDLQCIPHLRPRFIRACKTSTWRQYSNRWCFATCLDEKKHDMIMTCINTGSNTLSLAPSTHPMAPGLTDDDGQFMKGYKQHLYK